MLPQAQRDAVFATVRHGTVCTEGALSPTTANLMILKFFTAAAKTWRKLKRGVLLPEVVADATFKDGIEDIGVPTDRAVLMAVVTHSRS